MPREQPQFFTIRIQQGTGESFGILVHACSKTLGRSFIYFLAMYTCCGLSIPPHSKGALLRSGDCEGHWSHSHVQRTSLHVVVKHVL